MLDHFDFSFNPGITAPIFLFRETGANIEHIINMEIINNE